MVGDTGSRAPWRSGRPTIRWAAYAWAIVGFALAFVVVWRGLGYLRIVVAPLSLALFPAAILSPVAGRLERAGWPPAAAAGVLLAGFVLILVAILTAMGWQVQSQLSGLVDELRSSYEQLREQVSSVVSLPRPDDLFGGSSGGGSGGGSSGAGGSGGAAGGGSGGGAAGGAPSVAVSFARTVTRFFTELLLFLVAIFFYVKDRDRIAGWIQSLFPSSRRDDVGDVQSRVWDTISAYIRGQTIVAAVDGVLVAIGLLIAGVPLAVPLGILVFFGAFIPVVGSITAGAVAVIVALVSGGLTTALITLAIIVGVQQFEGNVLAPVVLSRELELHPLAVLCAVTAGAVLLGPWGAIIAVPAAASVARIGSYVRRNRPGVDPVHG